MTGDAKTVVPSFRNLLVRLSIPALLEGFNCCKSFKKENLSHTWLFLILSNLIFPYLLGGFGSFLTSSFAN